MEMPLGVLVMQWIFEQLDTYRAALAGPLLGGFRNFSRAFVTVYVIAVGYSILMGKAGDRAKSWGLSIALLVALQGLILESNGYNQWVFAPVMGTALDLASFFGGTEVGQEMALFAKLDESIANIMSAVDRLDPGGNFLTNTMAYLKVAAASLVLVGVVCVLYGVYLALSLLALFAIYVLLIVGGPFIFFAAFAETRFIAKTWLKMILQYALWLALLALVMSLAIPGVTAAANSLSNWDVVRDGVFTKQYGLTLLLCGVVIYFLLKVSDLSAGLTGGVGMQAGAVGGMVGGALFGMGSLGAAGVRGAAGLAAQYGGTVAAGAGYAAGRGAAAAASGAVRAYSAMKGIN